MVNNNVPAKTVPELVALAKKQPLTFGSSGSGTSIRLPGELFNTLAGVKMQHVPYNGRAAAIPDLLGGRPGHDLRQHAVGTAVGEIGGAARHRGDQCAATARVLALPDVKEKLATLGLDASPGTPDQLAATVQSEMTKWARVVKEAGAKVD